jgi:hypothetical protein
MVGVDEVGVDVARKQANKRTSIGGRKKAGEI